MAYDIPMDIAMKEQKSCWRLFGYLIVLTGSQLIFKGNETESDDLMRLLIEPSLYHRRTILGLDPLAINALLELMVEMKRRSRYFDVYAYFSYCRKYCDRFVVLHNGEIRADGSLEMLRKNFSCRILLWTKSILL